MSMRGRNIKPGFWVNEVLGNLPFEYRLLFMGLWCLADRAGLLEDRPERIHAQLFPYDASVDVDAGLAVLAEKGFLVRYEAESLRCIHVVNFRKHQSPHHTERASVLPGPCGGQATFVFADEVRQEARRFMQRIFKVAVFQSEEWRAWVLESVRRVCSSDVAGADLFELVEYVEKCADPVQRTAKDLGELKNPAGYIVKGIKRIAGVRLIVLPDSPRMKRPVPSTAATGSG